MYTLPKNTKINANILNDVIKYKPTILIDSRIVLIIRM